MNTVLTMGKPAVKALSQKDVQEMKRQYAAASATRTTNRTQNLSEGLKLVVSSLTPTMPKPQFHIIWDAKLAALAITTFMTTLIVFGLVLNPINLSASVSTPTPPASASTGFVPPSMMLPSKSGAVKVATTPAATAHKAPLALERTVTRTATTTGVATQATTATRPQTANRSALSPQPAAQTSPQAAAQPASQPAAQPVAQPVAQLAPQPVVAPVVSAPIVIAPPAVSAPIPPVVVAPVVITPQVPTAPVSNFVGGAGAGNAGGQISDQGTVNGIASAGDTPDGGTAGGTNGTVSNPGIAFSN